MFHSMEAVKTHLPSLLGHSEDAEENWSGGGKSGECCCAKALIIGGAFEKEVIEPVRQLPGSDRVPWLQDNKVWTTEEWQAMSKEDVAVSSAERMKRCLWENGLVPGAVDGVGAGDVWLY